MIKENLQIIIITYNRAKYLERTLNKFFEIECPIKDCHILVLDNNSNDNTKELIENYQAIHPNLQYIKNNKNVGANANIAKAFEYNTKKYLWIVADDDLYDFANWQEVETAMLNNEKAIVISRQDLHDEFKDSKAKILTQCAFVSACIFHNDLITDTVMRNIYDNVYCMFPHLIPLVAHINNNGDFYVVNKEIIKHASYENMQAEDTKKKDLWTRGAKFDEVYRKTRTITFETGFAIAISELKDEELKHTTMELLFTYLTWWNGLRDPENILKYFFEYLYKDKRDISQITDLYINMDNKYGQLFESAILNYIEPDHIFEYFFQLCENKRDIFPIIDLCINVAKKHKYKFEDAILSCIKPKHIIKYLLSYISLYLYKILIVFTFGKLRKTLQTRKNEIKYFHRRF